MDNSQSRKRLSLILFSGEYDKALAALILANSAKEMDIEASIFFTFWGLNLIRDPEKMTMEDKTASEKMFGLVSAKGAEDLPLSKMNMAGLGKIMLKEMMEENKTPNLTDFLRGAQKKGVHFYACKLSLEVMGFEQQELLPEVEVKTAYDYLQEAFESQVQLFI